MKNVLRIIAVIFFLSAAVSARGEEMPVICKLKEVLNFNRPMQVIFLRIDMKNRTINGMPSKVFGDEIITYETEAEVLTVILPTLDITVVRKGEGADNSDVRYNGVCYYDKPLY